MRIIPRKPASPIKADSSDKSTIPEDALPLAMNEKADILAPFLDKNEDIIKRSFSVGKSKKSPAQAIYLNQVVDMDVFYRHVLEPLMQYEGPDGEEPVPNLISFLTESSLSVGQVMKAANVKELVHYVFDGMVVILLEGYREAMVVDIHGGEFRALEEPPGERSARGPREGFVENMDINISMIRRRLRDPKLVVKKTMIGRRTRTQVAVLYIEDIASPEMVKDLRTRLDAIDTDGITATGYIEQYIEESPWSLFPQVWSSERPDRLAVKLLEGRIVIIAHGTPLALAVPSLAIEFFQASEDYYERTVVGSFFRLFRFFAFFLALSLPALYVAVLSFQPELVPKELLISLARARREVPLSPIYETLIQEAIIQLVIEAGLRLPGSIGQTVAVVAGIIMGQAAISAKLASPGIIVLISITTIATFALPNLSLVWATRVLRFPVILLSASFGMFGFSFAWLIIITHLAGLSSLGVPFLAPFAPTRYGDLKDSLWRTFIWKMKWRPRSLPVQEQRRQP